MRMTMKRPVPPRRPLPRCLRRLARAQEGATLVEFALIAPALSVMLLGSLDVGHSFYMQSVLQGAIQKAARDGTLEQAAGTSPPARTTIDNLVKGQLGTLNKTATVTITRRSYRTFEKAAAAQAEEYSDTNANNRCDANESYTDANNNNVWDADGGNAIGTAGARDNIVYTITISYPDMFPLEKLVGGDGQTTLTAKTVLANQPFGDQGKDGTPTVRNCT